MSVFGNDFFVVFWGKIISVEQKNRIIDKINEKEIKITPQKPKKLSIWSLSVFPKWKNELTFIVLFRHFSLWKKHLFFNKLILFLLENDIVDFQSVNDERCEDVNYFFFFFPEIRKDLYFFYSILNENPELIPVIEKIDIEQHYMLRKRGCNENPLAVLIRDDNIDELTREINAKNVNTILDYSYYERFEFVNSKSDMPTLIEYSAFFGSIKSFKFLLNCNARINNDLPQFAVAGGNVEIIRICIEKKLVFDDECFEVAIRYHQNSIVEYFHRELNKSFSRKSVLLSVKSHNYQQFLSSADQ